jgi:uncharacterized phage protein gp47/JayE
MPWQTPTLEQLRATNRSNVQGQLRSGPMIPNSVLRVMTDSNAGLAYLTLLYINWLALQLMPDTAETEWLDRFANIWRPGGVARKTATYASAVIQFTSIGSIVMPAGTILTGTSAVTSGVVTNFVTLADTVIGNSPTNVNINALLPGSTMLISGSALSLQVGIAGINGSGIIFSIVDGLAEETDDDLRVRVLDRIRQPPMGGDANDYVQWALAVPGVTRAWSSPGEMGVGTVTVRIMMDILRAGTGGFPNGDDINGVMAYLNTKRPVAVKDFFVVAPIPEPINFTISNLVPDSTATRAAIVLSVQAMLNTRAAPAIAVNGVTQPATTIWASWVSEAILDAIGVQSFTLTMVDHVMPSNGSLAVLGSIVYV